MSVETRWQFNWAFPRLFAGKKAYFTLNAESIGGLQQFQKFISRPRLRKLKKGRSGYCSIIV